MRYLSETMKLRDLNSGDRFYFAADLVQSEARPGTVEWEFIGRTAADACGVAQMDPTQRAGGKGPRAEKPGDSLVVRISE